MIIKKTYVLDPVEGTISDRSGQNNTFQGWFPDRVDWGVRNSIAVDISSTDDILGGVFPGCDQMNARDDTILVLTQDAFEQLAI